MDEYSNNSFLNLTDKSRKEAIDLVNTKRDLVVQAQSDLSEYRDSAQRMMEIFKNQIWSDSDLAFFDAFDASPIQFSVARPLVNKLIYRERSRKFQYRFAPQDIHSYRRYESERERYVVDNLHKHDYSKQKAGEFYDNHADDEYGRTMTGMTSKYRKLSKGKYKESECFEGGLITGVDFLKAEKDVDGKPYPTRRSFQKMFWDTQSTEYDLSDAEYIGEVEEYTVHDLIAEFPEHKEKIEKHFKRYTRLNGSNRLKVDKEWKDWFDFSDTSGPKVKVCDFWYWDTEKRYMIYDTQKGDERLVEYDYTIDDIYDELMIKIFNDLAEQAGEVDEEMLANDPNLKQKIAGMVEKRFEITETFRKVCHQCVFSFNSLLVHKRSYYPHGGHPYRPFFAQFNDGNFTSFLEDIEEIVIAQNKALAFREMLMAHSSKGMLIVDEKTIEKSDYTIDDVAEEYTRIGGLLPLKLKVNQGVGDVIQQLTTVGDGIGAINSVIADYDQRLYNISGVNLAQLGITQGETPTSRYKMQLSEGQENNGLIFDNFVRTKETFYEEIFVPLVAERIKNNPEEVARMVGRQQAEFNDVDFNHDFDLFVDAIYNGEYTFELIPISEDKQQRTERTDRYWELALNGAIPIEIPLKYSDDPNRYDILREIHQWKYEQKLEQLQESVDLKKVQQMLLKDGEITAEKADQMLKKMRLQAQQNAEKQMQNPKNLEKIKQNANKSKKQRNINKSTSEV